MISSAKRSSLMFENTRTDAGPAEAAVSTVEPGGAVAVDVVAMVASESVAAVDSAPSVAPTPAATAAAAVVVVDAVVVEVRISVEPLVDDAGAENADRDTDDDLVGFCR